MNSITGFQNIHVDHVASHIGKSEGIIRFIKSIPYNAAKNQVLIPLNLLVSY